MSARVARAALMLAAILAAAAVAALAATPGSPGTTPTPAPVAPPAGQAAPEATPAPASELPKCGDCHDEQVKAFAGNPHARWSHKGPAPDLNGFCETCHGDGTKHIEAGGDATLIQTFKTGADAELCLSCHAKSDDRSSFTTGFHANTEAVNCLSCHSIHKAAKQSPQLLKSVPGSWNTNANVPPPLCQSCHANITASFRSKPYAHRLDRGGMTCVDCHDPHGRKGTYVRLTRQGELPCLNCHAEKRGPFVFDHVTGSAGDCLSCHQPHGSNNPKMLNWARVDQLCLSCHSQTGGPRTAGAQPPSFHDLTLPRYRNCTSCHVAVHGSNLSPSLLK